MRVASQATEGATKMKSHTKPALRAMPAAQAQISLAIRGVLRDVRHAFLGLCIDAGQRVLAAMMEADRITLCGPKGVPDARRRAVRGGTTASQVVLGGQRIAVRRPRARSKVEGELALPSFAWATCADPLDAATMAAIAAGVSTRSYASTQEPVPATHQPRAASKRSGPVCLNSFPRFISGLRAGCRRCGVVHGGGRRLRRTDRRGGQLGAHQRSHLMRPTRSPAGWRSSARPA
jgi:hypothetical protein